ncbi:hypothetical protein GQ44DRAFT_709384 [Phaeosphaeriaceae sp. PMI808]|nr:hypothetical protein GQ44DRAFT_709384 [Phaeosphaeriaceae sp. PMI808]
MRSESPRCGFVCGCFHALTLLVLSASSMLEPGKRMVVSFPSCTVVLQCFHQDYALAFLFERLVAQSCRFAD